MLWATKRSGCPNSISSLSERILLTRIIRIPAMGMIGISARSYGQLCGVGESIPSNEYYRLRVQICTIGQISWCNGYKEGSVDVTLQCQQSQISFFTPSIMLPYVMLADPAPPKLIRPFTAKSSVVLGITLAGLLKTTSGTAPTATLDAWLTFHSTRRRAIRESMETCPV